MSGRPIDSISGLSQPFRVDPTTGRLATTSGAAKIDQDIAVLLATRIGERPLQRSFGTRLRSLVQQPLDDVLIDAIPEEISAALLQWEPRVLVTGAEVSVEHRDGAPVTRVHVRYRNIVDSSEQTAVVEP
ncbi:MAG: GPW/gp25 family protein [Microthrixaceae bacterium]|nr:GPW/gp25 family protein [Actinomycetota bacterium]HMS14348.1 GPW/gp25 family protein [Microthrixaceae bacterium]HMT25062.1 GPW/gp25 family protein [Microthrixaceae bacterium]HMT63070.1 GPW/gp25 family protein [Microthrixaceae bacterium]